VLDARGKRFGFELVFFRMGQQQTVDNPSAWAIKDLFLAHAALTDIDGRKFYFDQRPNRQGPGIAGASFADQRVWNGNWQVRWNGETQTLDAVTSAFRFHLDMRHVKPFVINGENGVSQKAAERGRASHYVSFPRLAVSGSVTLAGHNADTVTGQAWMDHEWFTEQLAADQVGWDWFSVQLDDNTELMLFDLRRQDGSIDPYSSGTFVDAAGHAHHLRSGDFLLTPGRKSGKYPVEWKLRVPSLHIDLDCRAAVDQELRVADGPHYWEGAVTYAGSHKGVGYLEMTGYDGTVSFAP
jgi:predicted secreted hydrolase